MMLLLAALLGTALAFPEIARWKRADTPLQQRRVCYDDDTLLSFRYWILDSEPYCSSLLGIEDITSTLPPATSRTTTTTVADAVTTLPQTLTVAQVTEIVTTTITAGGILKRDGTVDVVPQPYSYDYVSSLASEADQNAVIASSVFSACSCLYLAPKTTRSIQGSNVVTEYAATVTAGTSTITVTSNALPVFTYPYLNTSEPSTDSTSFITVSSTSTRYNTTYVTGTALPSPLNTTSLLPPYPTSNTSSATALNTTGPSLDPTSSYSASSSNTSTAILSIGTSINMSSSAPTITSTAPPGIGTSINPRGCNTINNTIFTDDTGRQYQIQCYLRYGGPVSIGLDSSTFRECMDECSTVNAGFSAIRCYGVTWLQYARGTVRCNLKARAALLEGGVYDGEAVSAVLLTGVPPPVAGQFRIGDGGDDDWGSGAAGSLADHDPGTWRVGRVA
ncbi:MAG: hypothetical protein Q9173_004967 [Seirophora scorigena]